MSQDISKGGAAAAPSQRRTITIERTYDAAIEDVWELWTTVAGIESWWGPDGFQVTVRKLELRPGGQMHYAMTATGAPQIAFMKREGMPLVTETRITYDEIVPPTRLAYSNHVDFVRGVEPYEARTVVELSESPAGVRLTLRLDAMHDEEWTRRAVMGWESELGKLAAALRRK